MFWTCVKDHIIDGKDDYKDIGLRGFDYKSFEEDQGGGNREGLDGYSYLKHLVQLCPGDWVKHMEKLMKRLVFRIVTRLVGEGNGQFVLSISKSSGIVLVAFYQKLPMGSKDT